MHHNDDFTSFRQRTQTEITDDVAQDRNSPQTTSDNTETNNINNDRNTNGNNSRSRTNLSDSLSVIQIPSLENISQSRSRARSGPTIENGPAQDQISSNSRDKILKQKSKMFDRLVNSMKCDEPIADFYDELEFSQDATNLTIKSCDSEESESKIICKFCYQNKPNDFISPCGCKGSIKFVHRKCLKLWRFRKNLKEIKTCEQCYEEYKLDTDIHFNRFFLHLITLSILILIVLVFNFVLNVILESIAFVLDEMLHENEYYYDKVERYRKDFLHSLFRRQNLNNLADRRRSPFELIDNIKGPADALLSDLHSKFVYLSYFQSTIVLVTIYQIFFSYTFLSTVNLFFTLWRLIQFDFKFDYIFLYFVHFLR